MQISARNQLKGKVASITDGAVNAVVAIEVDGNTVKANITEEAVKQLGLAAGKEAYVIIKATNVMFAKGAEPIATISARNQLAGKVDSVKKGAVNAHVVLALADGNKITGSITNEAIESLGLEAGVDALAIIKSTDVIVGVE